MTYGERPQLSLRCGIIWKNKSEKVLIYRPAMNDQKGFWSVVKFAATESYGFSTYDVANIIVWLEWIS